MQFRVEVEPLFKRACVLASAVVFWLSALVPGATQVEPPVLPTVYPLLTPASAINLPLDLRADSISVWHKGTEQRLFLQGHVSAKLGYRLLSAQSAAVTLTPTKEGGENTFDAAIFLNGEVVVQEGFSAKATKTTASELLVTTRITNSVNLSGAAPDPKMEEENAIVKRGDLFRDQLLNQPPPNIYLPRIVISDTEDALQNGWIARGPGNRIIAGPAELALSAASPGGVPPTVAPSTQAAGEPPKPKPKPSIFATADEVKYETVDGETVVLMPRSFYLMYTPVDSKVPIEFRAQQAVLFSAEKGGAASQPAQSVGGLGGSFTGAYLEGDVTIESGERTMRAERIYFDFTSMRAILLDASLSAIDEKRNVPISMRAAEIRMESRREFVAKSVTFSTSEFHTPHYHIGASEAYLQDITPRDEAGEKTGPTAYGFKAKDATFNVRGVPIFYWPYVAGDTNKNDIPLRKARVGYSDQYGMTVESDWDLFGLFGQREPKGVRADLNLDYFGKRGPAGGVDSHWTFDDSYGLLRSHIMQDTGTDDLGRDRDNIEPQQEVRGRATAREKIIIDPNWSLSLEGTYISDPNYLEQFFPAEFEQDKENETDLYLKYAQGTQALTFLGKWSLFDFTANADLVNDQYTTEKEPEIKYWRLGDSLLGIFTYYSETGGANVHQMFTNFDTSVSGLQQIFPQVPANQTLRQYYQSIGWTQDHVLRGDTRHELDLPLAIGDLKIVPYVTGRFTAWDQSFPEPDSSGSTTRFWGQGGVRGSMQFWRVYDEVESQFWDLHRMRHVIEPEFQVFQTGSTVARGDLQPFDPDVEDISNASGAALNLHQKWQTKRGGEGHWRNVDWLVLNVQVASFWHKQENVGNFFKGDPLRGMLFLGRPDLALVQNSINADLTWRIGEYTRFLAEMSYNMDDARLEQFAQGIAVDSGPYLSYFFGNRYVRAADSDQWTVGVTYQLTRKYSISAAESYDFALKQNVLSSLTLLRKLPRFNTAVTVTYDANLADTTVVLTMWPEGLPELGFGSGSLMGAGVGAK